MTTRTDDHTGAARADWEERIGRRSGDTPFVDLPTLPPPEGLRATAGRGVVSLDWLEVPGAVGYLVHTASGPDGPWTPLDHGGGDVLAVPRPPYADTVSGTGAWYAVASLSDVTAVGPAGSAVQATAPDGDLGRVAIVVDAPAPGQELPRPWRPMIGSEHLSYALSTDTVGGREVGSELRDALRMARDSWGVRSVRAHGILCDDLGVYREVDGEPVHDFSRVDDIYDMLVEMGLRPVVELSFMPHDLASDPTKTVFEYGAIVSPPRDWGRWEALVRDLAAHLVERYGLQEVLDRWSFEVWNEANLEVFWSGTPQEFWRMHDLAARAVKDVHPDLVVGGPSSAAAGWVEEFLSHVDASGGACDFVSTHTYGSPPLDLRPLLARHGRAGAPIWWTEWGVTPTHFNPVSDSVLSATFLLRGMRSALGTIEALSYWVVSDHFEELGRPPALFHGGFGLLTVGNLRKPRFWALDLLDRLGVHRLPVTATGDGADSLVESLATRGDDGRLAVLVWNSTLDQSKAGGSPDLARQVTVRFEGVSAGRYTLRHHRVDHAHGDLQELWRQIGAGADWPDEAQWAQLRAADTLAEVAGGRMLDAVDGAVVLEVELPMPGIALLELTPV